MTKELVKSIRDNNNRKTISVIGNITRVVVICCILVIYVGPFYISFLYSIKSHTDISRSRLAWPEHPTLVNYINVITRNQHFLTGYKNSVLTTIPTVFILMIITSMAAYVLARYNTKPYKFIYTLLISGIFIPFQCLMLPLYLNMSRLGLTSSSLGFIIVRTGMQISISILVVTGFVKTVPRELEEAAHIDGCSRFFTFWRIVFPLMKPVNATQLVLNTLFIWNDYNVAVVLLRTIQSRTLPLAQIIYFNENTTELNLAFAFFTMVMLPILILYLVMQKYIVSGVMAGAIKG
jgi:raffinose/stachyose/melibiose transport system permease protein